MTLKTRLEALATAIGADIKTLTNSKEAIANKGAVSGYAPLGTDQRVPLANLPIQLQTFGAAIVSNLNPQQNYTGWIIASNTTLNTPVAGNYYHVMVIAYQYAGYTTQIAFDVLTDAVWRRWSNNSVWQPWRRIDAQEAVAGVLPTNAIAHTFDRAFVNGVATAFTSGGLRMVAVRLKRGDVISSISVPSGTTAGAGLTHTWFALYDKSRALLANSADDTSATWPASTVKTLSLTTPYTVPTTDTYYIGINVTGTTPPSYQSFNSSSSIVTGIAPITTATSSTGLAATPPNPAAALSAVSQTPYAYVS